MVVVDIPGRQGRCMFILAAMKLGVEDRFGHDLLVALDLAVVLGCEGLVRRYLMRVVTMREKTAQRW